MGEFGKREGIGIFILPAACIIFGFGISFQIMEQELSPENNEEAEVNLDQTEFTKNGGVIKALYQRSLRPSRWICGKTKNTDGVVIYQHPPGIDTEKVTLFIGSDGQMWGANPSREILQEKKMWPGTGWDTEK